MFGFCVFKKFAVCSLLGGLGFFSSLAMAFAAPAPAGNSASRGFVLHDGAAVYQKADFDSSVIAYLQAGKIFEISGKTFGAFYRIRVKPGMIGYIADSDIKSSRKKNQEAAAEAANAPAKKKKKHPFGFTQYAGLEFAYVNYREDTMGIKPTASLTFVGAKLSGPNLVVSGAMTTDVNFLLSYGAPSYYSQTTGNSAAGWIFISDFLFVTNFPQGRNALLYSGFGPMLRYSKFDVQLGKAQYSLEDMALGAVFTAGLGLRAGRFALRSEIQYYWEKMQYYGGALALQMDF